MTARQQQPDCIHYALCCSAQIQNASGCVGKKDCKFYATHASSLGRDSMAFREKMERYHAEIERLVYAAEILCDTESTNDVCFEGNCPFTVKGEDVCMLEIFRDCLGDHIQQHDCMVPPCQCAGDTGEGTVRE